MYTYSLVFQVIDNKTKIHVKDMSIPIQRTRQVKGIVSQCLIAIAKARAERRLFETMAAKVAKELNTTKEDVIRAEEQGLIFVCLPYSVKYVGMTEK